MADSASQSRPLNCPKGYGLCWTCKTWCDMPGAKPIQRVQFPAVSEARDETVAEILRGDHK